MMVGVAMVLIIVVVVFRSNREKERLRSSGIKDIDAMDGIQFEFT
jgi:restriction system protein